MGLELFHGVRLHFQDTENNGTTSTWQTLFTVGDSTLSKKIQLAQTFDDVKVRNNLSEISRDEAFFPTRS